MIFLKLIPNITVSQTKFYFFFNDIYLSQIDYYYIYYRPAEATAVFRHHQIQGMYPIFNSQNKSTKKRAFCLRILSALAFLLLCFHQKLQVRGQKNLG
jgi:hypothetical protein